MAKPLEKRTFGKQVGWKKTFLADPLPAKQLREKMPSKLIIDEAAIPRTYRTWKVRKIIENWWVLPKKNTKPTRDAFF